MTVKEIEKLMQQVDSKSIKMNNLELFEKNFTKNKDKC